MPLRMTEGVPVEPAAAPPPTSPTAETVALRSQSVRRAGARGATKKGGAKSASATTRKRATAAAAAAPARAESPRGKVLALPRRRQGQADWCWAACVDMVMHYLGRAEVKQCEVVAKRIGRREVCAHPRRKEFSVSCPPRAMRAVWRSWDVEAVARLGGVRGERGWLSEKELVAELDAGRPVQIGFKWGWGGGHAVVVHGWRASARGRFFFVNDPWNWSGERHVEGLEDGIGQVSYEDLRQGYGMGRWKWTWSGLRRKG